MALGTRSFRIPFSSVACTLSASISTGKSNTRDIGTDNRPRWRYFRPASSEVRGSVGTTTV